MPVTYTTSGEKQDGEELRRDSVGLKRGAEWQKTDTVGPEGRIRCGRKDGFRKDGYRKDE